MLILNDPHIGVQRKAGTTPASQEALRNYLFGQINALLYQTDEKHLLILGDLFDDFEVDPRDWLDTYKLLSHWVAEDNSLTLVAGNHDHSPKAAKVSSFQMLCDVLVQQSNDVRVIGINEYGGVEDNVVAVAHHGNQDLFNMSLDKLLGEVRSGDRVLLHANYDNNFAAQSDHSLNVSRQQAAAFINKGVTLYFAHEHQARTAQGGSVVVFGNQFPTSISDCLENDNKCAHVMRGGVTKIQTWSRDDDEYGYHEIDWRDLADTQVKTGFVRVTGTASAAESADAMSAMSRYRQVSDVFVATNAVKIEGVAEIEALPEAFEVAKRFDILQYIEDNTTPEEFSVVRTLLEDAQ